MFMPNVRKFAFFRDPGIPLINVTDHGVESLHLCREDGMTLTAMDDCIKKLDSKLHMVLHGLSLPLCFFQYESSYHLDDCYEMLKIKLPLGYWSRYTAILRCRDSGKRNLNSFLMAQKPEDSWKRILVVDDEHCVCQVTCKMLEFIGFQAYFFNNPKDLIPFLKRGDAAVHYDALLTDYSMPEVSGVQLAGRVVEEIGPLPVILMSGYLEEFFEKEREVPGDLPVVSLLKKPFRFAELHHIILMTELASRLHRYFTAPCTLSDEG